MRANGVTNNFTAGEWSPFLDGRADLSKYESACIKLENFRPLPWGGVTYRAGSLLLGFAKYDDRPHRLIPFNYSTSVRFVIEMGDFYMRFWNSDGTPVQIGTAAVWVTATPYTAGNFVTDPGDASNFYYCFAAVTSATQPHSDPAHWTKQTAFELPTSLTVAQLPLFQYKQINAQIRFVHPEVPPTTLMYVGLTGGPFQLVGTSFRYPVLRDQNGTQAIKLNVAAITGSTTLISNTAGIFNAGHVGSYWELQHLRPAASLDQPLNTGSYGTFAYSASLAMEGAWTFTTSQFWDGEVIVQRSLDAGATWTTIRSFTAKCDQNFSTSGDESPPAIGRPVVLYRVGFKERVAPFTAGSGGNWVGAAPSPYAPATATLASQDAYIAGVVLVTAFTDDQHVTATVLIAPQDTSATDLWSEGEFSTYRGFPSSIAFFEQRLIYAGTTSKPNTVWGSTTGDFDNFKYTDLADGAFAFQPAVCQQNQVTWMTSLLRIHIATSGEEILVYSGNLDEGLTPSNVTIRAQSSYGSAPIQPLMLQNSILFVERNGRRVREMREMSSFVAQTDFVAPDLTLLAEHITQSGILYMDFGRIPDPLNYFVRNDGVMAVMTYNREQNINAWSRYLTNGTYEGVAVIYGEPSDEVFVSVKRTINGVIRRCIEAFTTDPATAPNIETNVLLDCATQLHAGTDFTAGDSVINGLTNYRNTILTAVVDGAEYPLQAVSNAGVLTLPAGVTAQRVVNIGFPYVGTITPMKPELNSQEGSSQGRRRRITGVTLRVRNSVSVQYAGGDNPVAADFRELAFRSPNDLVGSMTPLSGGTANPNGIEDMSLPAPWPDSNNTNGALSLRQVHPFPLTLIAIFHQLDVFTAP